jgi:hypothetical protein
MVRTSRRCRWIVFFVSAAACGSGPAALISSSAAAVTTCTASDPSSTVPTFPLAPVLAEKSTTPTVQGATVVRTGTLPPTQLRRTSSKLPTVSKSEVCAVDPVISESPLAVGIPIVGVAGLGLAVAFLRRRERHNNDGVLPSN